ISVTGSHCQYYNNRDIILTPHQLKTYPGKILYYRPHELNAAGAGGNSVQDNVHHQQQHQQQQHVPWEDVLKETVFLALNDNKTSGPPSPDGSPSTTTTKQPLYIMRQQKAIYAAPYLGSVDLTVPRFGDIVELAHGRLEMESDDAYFFVQDEPNQQYKGGRNVSAFWKVERIRHRDEQRGHRYELKFTVAPVRGQQLDEVGTVNRSFIVRDEDYPRYFGLAVPMMKKSDQFVDRAVFDPVYPYHPGFVGGNRFGRPTQATITLGEYLLQTLLGDSTPKVVHQPQPHFGSNGLRLGGGYNRIKFPDPFTTSSQSVPKFYHHIHFQRPSIAPLAPTLPPSPPLIKELHSPASSNIEQDYSKIVDLRGASHESQEVKPQQQHQQTRPTHIHHHHHQQPQQLQQPQQAPPQYYAIQPQQAYGPLPQNNPPPMQPLPQNLVQSIPVYNPQGQVMLNHIPIAPNQMIQMSQAPIAFPVQLQLVPSQGAQIYGTQQDPNGLHAVPIRIMQPAPVYHFLAPQQQQQQQHSTTFVTPKHPNQSSTHYSPNSIPNTTIKYATATSSGRYHYQQHHQHATTQPPSSQTTASNHRYAPLPTVQASPAGLREKFTAPAFQPVTALEPEAAGSAQVDSASPKFQSFGIENAVTPKSTTTTAVLPIATAAEEFTPSIGHAATSSGYYSSSSNFIDEKGAVSESGKVYSEPDPLYHGKSTTNGTTPLISITTAASPPYSSHSSTSYTKTSFTPKFTISHGSTPYRGVPSPTIVPPQLETPISSTLKSYHYLSQHDNYDFVPSRVVELAHVKKIPKKSGGKRKNPNHHSVTVTSHKPLKFSEGPDYATHRPESQLSVQLPPPEKDYGTYYGTAKQNHKVQKPKNYVTQPYSSSTTPFPTSLTTPTTSNTTTPLPATSSTASSGIGTTATTNKPFTHYQPYFKNKHEKSDDIITTMRPRLVIKTVYKPYPSPASGVSTEKPVLKWIPKRPRKNGSTASVEPSSSTSSSASIEQLSASSEHVPAAAATAVVESAATKPQTQQTAAPQPSARPSLENQVNRLRASRGRSRYTHRRPTPPGNPVASQHPGNVKAQRARSSSPTTTTTTTTTVKPVTTATEQPATVSLKNASQEKSKRDAATEENEILIAEPLVDVSSSSPPSYEMIKAAVKPIATNATNIILFEASDAISSASSSPSFNDLTMSIINHARAIANQTTEPDDLQTNEIGRGDDRETTLSMASTMTTTTTPAPTDESVVAESTVHEQATTTTVEGREDEVEEIGGTASDGADGATGSSRSETTVSV
ncbi:hypothetical protein pipiens_016168, partial [Culex pipiens pipiens]